jgi:GTP-binding protein HflX
MEELQRTWMGRLNGECLFVSALKKTGIENMRKVLYDRVKQLHVQKYPYNDFLYPDSE